MKDLDQSSYRADGGSDDCISNADIAQAVRDHLKMSVHIPVQITDSPDHYGVGEWRIGTVDIQADGMWKLAPGNRIEVQLGEMVTQGWVEELVTAPDDGPIIQVQDRMEDAGKQWHDIHTLIVRAIDRGDVDALRTARDGMMHLGASLLHMVDAMNRAIAQAE